MNVRKSYFLIFSSLIQVLINEILSTFSFPFEKNVDGQMNNFKM